jgi:hypothetical protein
MSWSNSQVKLAKPGTIPSSAILPSSILVQQQTRLSKSKVGPVISPQIISNAAFCSLVSRYVMVLIPKDRALRGHGVVAIDQGDRIVGAGILH